MQIGTQDEVAAAIDGDPRLAAWQVRRSGPGWIELETRRDLARIKAPLLLVLTWPAVWRDPVAVRPHLLRARSGNYALMLVGRPPCRGPGDHAKFKTGLRLISEGDETICDFAGSDGFGSALRSELDGFGPF